MHGAAVVPASAAAGATTPSRIGVLGKSENIAIPPPPLPTVPPDPPPLEAPAPEPPPPPAPAGLGPGQLQAKGRTISAARGRSMREVYRLSRTIALVRRDTVAGCARSPTSCRWRSRRHAPAPRTPAKTPTR